MGVKPRSIS
uniref:Uncharacterized protein n=1 Tax=Rhizophora mucronata TaxID=61149 RepID=A0A2P2IHF7_RHIMU